MVWSDMVSCLFNYLLLNQKIPKDLNVDQISDLMFYSLLGAILGGRAGYVFFYSIEQFISNPLSIFFIWQGGLSFHGSLLGVLIACFWLSKSWGVQFFWLMDRVAPFCASRPRICKIGKLYEFRASRQAN